MPAKGSLQSVEQL